MVDVPQTQFLGPVVMQRPAPAIQEVQLLTESGETKDDISLHPFAIEATMRNASERLNKKSFDRKTTSSLMVPVPQNQQEVAEVIQIIPSKCTTERILEQAVDALVPQIQEQIVEVMKIIPQERARQRSEEQIVDVPVTQVVEKKNGGAPG